MRSCSVCKQTHYYFNKDDYYDNKHGSIFANIDEKVDDDVKTVAFGEQRKMNIVVDDEVDGDDDDDDNNDDDNNDDD